MTRGKRPRLPEVVVCAADSVYPRLAARALELCIDRCDFADAILFSDTAVSGRFRHVAIDRLKSLADYSRFCLSDLPRLTDAPFVLVVQWDGYVVDPSAWSSAFLNYDYIGAAIYLAEGGVVVGNGGFSLRSRKLLDALLKLPLLAGVAEDRAICLTYRPVLERDFGIRFAPLKAAERFSYEVRHPAHRTFGFHGLPNLWRHEDDATIVAICKSLPPAVLLSFNSFGLMLASLQHDRVALAGALYALMRTGRSMEEILAIVAKWLPVGNVRPMIERLEEVYASDHL